MAEKKSVSVKVLNMAGEEVSKMNLNAEVFGWRRSLQDEPQC